MLNSKCLSAALLAVSLLGTSTIFAHAQEAAAPAAATETAAPKEDNSMWQNLKAKFGGRKDGRSGRHGEMHKALFMEVDTDKNGSVTMEEINAYRSTKVASADISKDGVLNLEEFSAAYNAMMKDRTVRGFQRLDADADGSITSAEIDQSITMLFARMDRNEDGVINKDDRPERGGKRDDNRVRNGGSINGPNN